MFPVIKLTVGSVRIDEHFIIAGPAGIIAGGGALAGGYLTFDYFYGVDRALRDAAGAPARREEYDF